MTLMSKAAILGAADIEFEDIDLSHVPGWGTVRIKDLTAKERDRLEKSIVIERVSHVNGRKVKTQDLRDNVRATFCAACIVDEALQSLFDKSDIDALGRKSSRALDAIFTVIRRRNGILDDDIEELAGNSVTSQDEDSPIE